VNNKGESASQRDAMHMTTLVRWLDCVLRYEAWHTNPRPPPPSPFSTSTTKSPLPALRRRMSVQHERYRQQTQPALCFFLYFSCSPNQPRATVASSVALKNVRILTHALCVACVLRPRAKLCALSAGKLSSRQQTTLWHNKRHHPTLRCSTRQPAPLW
jgi:hypothetical protein